jgi:hypothetical protein
MFNRAGNGRAGGRAAAGRSARFACAVLIAGLLSGVVACSTYRDHLNRGQRYYDENDYEKALALWRALEPDMDSLSDQERARYCYLRGMTDYRLGYRSHARHWLAVAQAIENKYPGGLEEDWRHRADEAIEDLNKDVFGVERFDAAEAPAPADTETPSEATETVSEPAEKTEPTGPKACRTDSDCAGDQVCISRKCVSP